MSAKPAIAIAIDPLEPVPVLVGRPDDRALTEALVKPLYAPTTRGWKLLVTALAAGMAFWLLSLATTLVVGIGAWGNNIPVAWAFDITTFVWWIGIGHAGTLISAILLLFQQKWRTSINRFAEAMTLFAVAMAGVYPIIHLGRPWFFWWLMPYPATLGLWPNFKSALPWDVFAISTYATVSFLFWFMGLIPDLATLRDTAPTRLKRTIYGLFAFGWRGSARHWQHYRIGYLLMAGLGTPLVVSVHTIVSFDFAISQLPGWHTTIFPPYFVAGAIYSGFAMVLTLAIPLRKFYHLEQIVTLRHIDNMGKIMLATGFIVAYGYAMEAFMAWYSADHWEAFTFWNRAFGPMGWSYWVLLCCNLFIPLTTLWSRKLRTSIPYMFVLSLVVNTGMWFERFVIIVTSLTRDFLPSSWGTYYPTKWDYMTYGGTLLLFLCLFLLFVRFLPMIPMSEVRTMLPGAEIKPKAAAEVGD